MANIEKLAFAPLDVNGKNYLRWTREVRMHLTAMGIYETIEENNNSSAQDKAKSFVFLHKHIDDYLKDEHMHTEDPRILWNDLKERFDHQKDIILPSVRNEWNNLRFQDFKKVNEFSSAMFRIVTTLRFCGETVTEKDMLEKTYSTFHASNITLQQQYRMRNFSRFSELNTVLLVAEQNNELLMKNHQSRPTGSAALPEVNAVNKNDYNSYGRGRGRGRGFGRGRGRGRRFFHQNHYYNHDRNYNSGRGNYRGRGHGRGQNPRDNKQQSHGRSQNNEIKTSTSHGPEEPCYRCGMTGHWSRTCRTAPHLCKLYQESIKGKGKEVNLVDLHDDTIPELNASDFGDDMC